MCLLVLILLDHTSFFHPPLSPDISALVTQRTNFEATLLEPLEISPESIRARARVTQASGRAVSFKALLYFESAPLLNRGDYFRGETRWKRPQRYRNPGIFDFRRALEREDVVLTGYVADKAEVSLLAQNISFLNLIDQWREKLAGRLSQGLPVREAGFLKALLLGDRSGVTPEEWELFQKTGTTHLVSVSGQHLGMVSLPFFAIFLWLLKRSERVMLTLSVRQWAGWMTLAPVIFYTILAGAPPSALRALIVGVFLLLALAWKREVDPWNALAGAALLISIFSPAAVFTLSFQLSFLAVMGILIFRRESTTRVDRWIKNPFLMGLGATLLTAPLVLVRFHMVSVSGLLINLLAIPAVTILLLTSGGLLGLSLLFPAGSLWFLKASGFLAKLYLAGLDRAALFSWTVEAYPNRIEQILLGLFILGLLWFYRDLTRRKQAFVFLIVVMMVSGIYRISHSDSLRVTFLDIGQGDGALIQAPDGANLLIDAGGFLIPGQKRSFDVGERVVVPTLKYLGVKKLDAILLSHPHPDHYGGLEAVVQKFPVGEFWSNGQRFPDSSFDSLMKSLEKTPQRLLRGGESFDWHGLKLEVLYPQEVSPFRTINDNSLVVRISQGEARFLFSGDIEQKGEASLSDGPDVRATVLKIPHHASRTSSSIPFIDSVRPDYAVASLGDGNFFGFPHPDILERYERRGVKVLRTDRNGAVMFTVPRDFPRTSLSIEAISSGE